MSNETFDVLASEEEVREAIDQQIKNPSPRIAAGAIWILSRNPRLRKEIAPAQLITLAYEAILSTRNWRKEKVDFPTYVVGVMRSLAFNDSRKIKHTRPQIVYGQDEVAEQITEGIKDNPTPEQLLIQKQTAKSRIARLEKLLEKDTVALDVFKLLIENGLSKAEIRSALNLSDTKFWSADRKILRAIEKLGDE